MKRKGAAKKWKEKKKLHGEMYVDAYDTGIEYYSSNIGKELKYLKDEWNMPYLGVIWGYAKSFTEETWDWLIENTFIFPDVARLQKDISDSLHPELFNFSYEVIKKLNKHFITIVEDTEGHCIQCKVHEKVHKVCEKTEIPVEKILIITNDINAKSEYDNWFEKIKKYETKLNIVSYPCYVNRLAADFYEKMARSLYKEDSSTRFGRTTLESGKYIPVIDFQKHIYKPKRRLKPNKKFICLMGRSTDDRSFFWEYFQNGVNVDILNTMVKRIKSRKLSTKWGKVVDSKTNYISFDAFNYAVLKTKHKKENKEIANLLQESGHISYVAEDVILENSYQDIDTGNSLTPRENILYGRSGPLTDKLEYYYEDSYFSIVPECLSGTMLSEKWVKPIYHGHPFMILSPLRGGILKKMREWGFETFPEIFDESYDEMDNRLDRVSHIENEILRLCKMDMKELQKLRDSVYEKLVHNQKTLFNMKLTQKPFTDILK